MKKGISQHQIIPWFFHSNLDHLGLISVSLHHLHLRPSTPGELQEAF